MLTYKSIDKEAVHVPSPKEWNHYSAQQLIDGDCPEGVYDIPTSENGEQNRGYMIVVRKDAGDRIENAQVADTCNVLLCYYPKSRELHPGTPRADTYWQLCDDAEVAFDVNILVR